MKIDKLSLKMLLEEEGEESGGEIELSPDDEAADDAGDTVTDEENTTSDEPEEEVEVSPEDEVTLRKPLEAQVDAVLADFEMDALKSAKVNEASGLNLTLLLEEEIDFDIQNFSSSVARLIDNYETLLDIESAIYYRAIAILEKNYDDTIAHAFREIMHTRYNYDFGDVRVDPIKGQAPLALGTGGDGGGT